MRADAGCLMPPYGLFGCELGVKGEAGVPGTASIDHEAVAYAGFGAEVAGPRGIGLQLPAQLCHVDAEVLSLFAVLRTPDFHEQLPLGDDFAGMAHEGFEEPELDGG